MGGCERVARTPIRSIRRACLTNLAKLTTINGMSRTYGIGEAKTQLSRLVRQAEEGEEVILRRGSHPVVRLVALTGKGASPKRTPGTMRGRVNVPDDFDEWPEDIAKALGIIE
jgi:antitoxin (DNA-binding transcriptional repressor) of toxin-antitoxin stability system